MDKSKHRELESVINSQKEQLLRYETRLKDVVTAYKGLLKEKEALESSFSALNKDKTNDNTEHSDKTKENGNESDSTTSKKQQNETDIQIATLMNSLATLSAEKSRMESSFQADKKQIRNEMALKDKQIKDLQDKLKSINTKALIDLENMRSKIIVERHERDKEHNDHMIMIKELQKLLSDERHLKENLEMQLNDLKTQFTATNSIDRTIKELSQELEATKKKLKQYENNSNKSSLIEHQSNIILQQLQSEMATLKHNHSIAIKGEQKRAQQAEEHNKKLSSIHEERVANLESRLAELSTTVGNYDRLRQIDQENIYKLKEKIAQLINSNDIETNINQQPSDEQAKNINDLMEEILHLQNLLITENNKLEEPRDLSKLFLISNQTNVQTLTYNSEHKKIIDELNKSASKIEKLAKENEILQKENSNQKHHIKTLQEKVKVLNYNIDEQETELKIKVVEYNSHLKNEKLKAQEFINQLEIDYRNKMSELENQLHKQRDRSLLLLEEKENEIKTLKTSFEIFLPHQHVEIMENETRNNENIGTSVTGSTSLHLSSSLTNQNSIQTTSNATESQFHMLHYAHDLARKEVEISALRKAKHSAETSLRQALQDKVASQEILHNRISSLEDNVDRLERNKSREGENLEYLKNVILSFLITNDNESKRHMLNAIGAVLKFNPSEIKQLNKIFFKKSNK